MGDDEGGHVHRYRAGCHWSGSTDAGYDAYRRSHTASFDPTQVKLELSADPAFLGEANLVNPEQLIVAASSSCQLLSFLAVCARARIDVLSYDDEAEGEMPVGDATGRPRITRIVLRPRIRVGRGVDPDRVRHLVEVAHRDCYVANSLTSEVIVDATITVGD